MKIHALRDDGRAICGLELRPERLLAITDGSGSLLPDAAQAVTCSSCRRLADLAAQPLGDDEAIRAIVREEISLGIEQLLRVKEVADVLAVSKKNVLKLLDKGELSVVRVSRKKLRVPASSVEAFIRRRAT